MTTDSQNPPKRLKHRGIYLLPNLFTTAALFAGFYAIVAAVKGMFDIASLTVFIAMIADTLDGRVARLTNTASAFGAEYDSLSDMASFGIAPALIVYNWALLGLGKIGWLVAFLYVAATALRLARFNTQIEVVSKRYFQGLPCPAAAGVLAGLVWFSKEFDFNPAYFTWGSAAITVALACLMVSNIHYHSFKQLDFKGKVPFFAILIVVMLFVLITVNPPMILFSAFSLYALSGPVCALIRYRRGEVNHEDMDEDDQADRLLEEDD
jgi:CDP-diacylglycerol---serine O-phosphatidyltransferase